MFVLVEWSLNMVKWRLLAVQMEVANDLTIL
jgi:hypothetical protein